MLTETLISLFERDLKKLKNELELYSNESQIWKIDREISNSAGNLTLHLIGNLNTYIGAQIGKTGYIRNRPLEFSSKDIPRSELIQKIEDTIIVVNNALEILNEKDYKIKFEDNDFIFRLRAFLRTLIIFSLNNFLIF
mgnify:CR=1 FL=1